MGPQRSTHVSLYQFWGVVLPERPLNKAEWYVADATLDQAQEMVGEHHYSKGGSNTRVYVHGLYRQSDDKLFGIAWWLPPTKVACQSVNKGEWTRVLSLTRLVCLPDAPKNSCSFLLSKSLSIIWKERKYVSLVTYADESQGHTGIIYKASNWIYVGRTGPYPRWLDSEGRQVSPKATVNRTKAQMETLGYRKEGSYYKHKFVLHAPKKYKSLAKQQSLFAA
jgi:hypothetical protein